MSTSPRLPLPPWLYAGLVYLGCALFVLYPAWTDLSHGVVGDWTHPDMISNHWLYRWIADRVQAGEGLLHNDRYYVPVGDAPWLAGNGSDAVPYALSAGWLAWPGSVTVWVLGMLVANGLGGYALARAVGASPVASTVAGATLVWCPYVARELSAGRFAQASLGACALFLAAWVRMLEAPAGRRGLLAGLAAGLCFGAAAFTYWYDGLWMAMAGAVLWFAQPRWRPLVAFVPAALATTLPPLAVFLSHWSEIPGTAEDSFPHPIAIAYAMVPSFPLWSGTGPLASLVLPMVCVGLAGLGLSKVPPRLRLGLCAAALLFYALSLGPRILAYDGSATAIPGPYVLVYGWTSTLRRFWWPYRHLAPLTIVLVPLVARGAERAMAWMNTRWSPVVLVALLPVELATRGAVTDVETSWFSAPEAYTTLAGLPPGAVLELPLASSITRTQASLSYERVDGHPRVNGHAMWVDRVRPEAWNTWVRAQPLLGALLAFEEGEGERPWSIPAGTDVAPEGVRYISLNREFFPGELRGLMKQHAAFLTAWFGEPVVKAGGVRVWDLTHLQGDRTWTFGTWSPPAGYVTSDGLSALPETVQSAGWRHWPRTFPPTEPSAGPSPDSNPVLVDPELPAMLRRKLEREAAPKDTGGGGG